MRKAPDRAGKPATAEVVDFEDALLDACDPALKADLLEEAALLLQAFAPEGRAEEVAAMARTLSGDPGEGHRAERVRARRLAAALRRLGEAG
jgi:hypothetical protein